MDPITVVSLVASAIGLADVVAKVSCNLRALQREYGGALEFVDDIALQVGIISFAIQQMSSFLGQRPDTLPSDFEIHFRNSTSSINVVAQQIQDHAKTVRDGAGTSTSKAKLLHLKNASKVKGWINTLKFQMEAWKLLLEAAKMHSNYDTSDVLEQASSKIVFERASSMSAKLGDSCRSPVYEALEISTRYTFEEDLFQSKVYRRALKSSYIRHVTQTEEDRSAQSDSALHLSVSSGHSDIVIHEVHSPQEDVTHLCIEPNFTTTQSRQSQGTHDSTNVYVTGSTLATTVSSISKDAKNGELDLKPIRDRISVRVTVESVGEEHSDLVIQVGPGQYNILLKTIGQIKSDVLLSASMDPSSYSGIPRVLCITTDLHGLEPSHYNCSQKLFEAAVEELLEGWYASFEVQARFPAPDALEAGVKSAQALHANPDDSHRGNCKETSCNIVNCLHSEAKPRRYQTDSFHSLSFLKQELVGVGGSADVYRVTLHSPLFDCPKPGHTSKYFALKQFRRSVSREFDNEVTILETLSRTGHSHIIKLLASFKQNDGDSLLFPWAECDLRSYWNRNMKPHHLLSGATQHDSLHWLLDQCAGIADGLALIHHLPNGRTTQADQKGEEWIWHHGDIKPENILWFRDESDTGNRGILKISDFGIARFDSRMRKETVPDCTPSYRAPEFDLGGRGRGVNQPSDVWSLGCLYLEFVTWYLAGQEGILKLERSRREYDKYGAFFVQKDEGTGAILNPLVSQQMQKLYDKAIALEPFLRTTYRAFLDEISWCLQVEVQKRRNAQTTARTLKLLAGALVDASPTGTGVIGRHPRAFNGEWHVYNKDTSISGDVLRREVEGQLQTYTLGDYGGSL